MPTGVGTEGRRKPAGFILDFVGIFDRLESALAFDSDEVSGVVEGIEVLQQRFSNLMKDGEEDYLPLWAGLSEDKAAEAVLEHFRDEEKREEYYKFFRELEEIYEILSPDPFLRDYLEDYEELSRIYQILRTAYEPHVTVDGSFLRKTALLVREHIRTPVIRAPEQEYQLTPEALKELAEQDRPETIKIFNLLMAIRKIVEDKSAQMPYLVSIGERAETIAEAFEQRLSTTREALDELHRLVEDLNVAQERRKRSDLSDEAFSAYVYMEGRGVGGAEKIARETSRAFQDNPHWDESKEQEKQVRVALYKSLRGSTDPKEMVEIVEGLMTMLKRAS